MKLLSVDNYVEFECIGGDCPISCCGGNWKILVDDKTYEYYKSVEGEFGDRLRDGIIKMNEHKAFRLDEKTRDCVFLNENKLCSIYRNLGPNALCETCRSYPRVIFPVGDIEFCYLTNSCPEVNRLIFQRTEPLNTLYDDSETEGEEKAINDFDIVRFNSSLRAFNAGMHIIQNRDIALNERLLYLLFFVSRFQDIIREDKDAAGLIAIFSDSSMYTGFLKREISFGKNYASMIHAFMLAFRIMIHDSYDHPMWLRCNKLAEDIRCKGIRDIDRLEVSFQTIEKEEIQTELEQLMAYRFFAVFMQGYNSSDYLDRLAYEYVMYAALCTYIALTEYGEAGSCSQEDRILFASLFGRIEHANKSKREFIDSIKDAGFNTVDKLIGLIL